MGIIKTEMYSMYKIDDEKTLRSAIKEYIYFYDNERPQERFGCRTPMEVRQNALTSDVPAQYPIPVNKRIEMYKENGLHKKTATLIRVAVYRHQF